MIIRKLLVATSAMFLASSAFGADLSGYYKGPPPAYAASDWSGFYIGVHGGGGWATTNNYADPYESDAYFPSGNATGGVIGAHFGYNWQFYNSIVAGLEVDADAADINNTTSGSYVSPGPSVTGGYTVGEKIDSLATVRGRLGWTVWNSFMLYATGGLAWARGNYSGSENSSYYGAPYYNSAYSSPFSAFGYVVGVGGEFQVFSPRWLARVEYLHYDFGNGGSYNYTYPNSTSPGSAGGYSFGTQTVDVIRGGLTYKF